MAMANGRTPAQQHAVAGPLLLLPLLLLLSTSLLLPPFSRIAAAARDAPGTGLKLRRSLQEGDPDTPSDPARMQSGGGAAASAGLGSDGAAFLEAQLPLQALLTAPKGLMQAGGGEAEAVTLYDRDPLTVVFSRPAIALGADFSGSGALDDQFPFSLDCPVPGKMRWVTTAIARYDPDVDWPSDLACTLAWDTAFVAHDGAALQLGGAAASLRLVSDPLTMRLDYVQSDGAAALTGGQWDASSGMEGDKLPEVPPDGRIRLAFDSPVNLRMMSSALQVAEEGTGDVVEFELMPCDGLPPAAPEAGAVAAAAGTPDLNDTCIALLPTRPLKADTYYTVLLPAGSKYHALSGPLGEEQSVQVAGLRPFRIPFRPFNMPQDAYDTPQGSVAYRRLELWLPHGLAEGVTPDQLLPLISVCQYADGFDSTSVCNPLGGLSLEALDKGMLLLTVPSLQPLLKYRISVAASGSVKDGFGLPLLASSGEFWTAEVAPAWVAPDVAHDTVVLEDLAGAPSLDDGAAGASETAATVTWRYAVRPLADQPAGGLLPSNAPLAYGSVAAWSVPVETDEDVSGLLDLMSSYNLYLPEALGAPSLEVVPKELGGGGGGGGPASWRQVELPLPGPPGVHVVAQCCDKRWYAGKLRPVSSSVQFILRTRLSVTAVTSGPRVVAWVTDAQAGGGGVEGALVRLLARPNVGQGQDQEASAYVASRCTTDATGTCALDMGDSEGDATYAIVVNSGSQVAMVRQAWFNQLRTARPWLATLVLDRLLVVPGESLKVTGFVQAVAPGGALSLPRSQQVALRVSPPFVEGSNDGDEPIQASLNGDTGTVHAEVRVPASAKPSTTYTLSLRLPAAPTTGAAADGSSGSGPADGPGQWPAAASVSFTVADPRPPTAELRVSAPSWTKPGGTVKVDVAAVSYIGASVDGAEMTLTWSHALAQGQVALTTDVDGKASAVIDLGDAKYNRTTAGDSVSIEVEWVGPTRERIVQAASVSVQDAARTLALSRSLDTKLPGVAFGVGASLVSNQDGSAVKGVPVSVTLKPNATNGPEPASAACAHKQLSAACSVQSGDAAVGYAGCQLALPCPGVFVLEGCTAAGGDGAEAEEGQLCASVMLGWSEEAWAAAPWKYHDEPTVWTDRPSYSIGDTAVLSFQNPWPGARALVAWGNLNAMKTKVVPGGLPADGLATISITLGDECTGGCGVTLVLDVPRVASSSSSPPGEGLAAAPGVAVSKLFDPLAPHTVTMSTGLQVDAPNSLEVAVSVAGGSGLVAGADGGAAPGVVVVEQGTQAQVTVDVKVLGGAAAAGASVTLYAVDESFLALAPYPLPRPQADMVLSLAASFSAYGSDALRLAPNAVREVFAKLMARLTGIDPWLPPDTVCDRRSGTSRYERGGDGPAAAAVDAADDAYLRGHTTAVTYTAGNGFTGDAGWDNVWQGGCTKPDATGMVLCAGIRHPGDGNGWSDGGLSADDRGQGTGSADSGRDAGNGQGQGSASGAGGLAVRSQLAFSVTPLFVAGIADASGRATFTFTAPPNMGTFALRAFAASGSAAKYGSGEGKVVVKRRLSLTPSLPRFVRVGDAFEAGVIVTVGSAPTSVVVTAKLEDGSPLELSSPAQLRAAFGAGGGGGGAQQQEVRFSFQARAMGGARITLTASAEDGAAASDGLELELDVLGQQGDVWVATSFAVAASAGGSSAAAQEEGLELPAAVPGSGSLSLTAGVGFLPTIEGLYSELDLAEDEQGRAAAATPTAPQALLRAVQPALLSYYGRTPSARQAASIQRAFEDLQQLTDGSLGLMYRVPEDDWRIWNWRPDVALNLWGVYLLKRHQPAFLQAAGQQQQQQSGAELLATYGPLWQTLLGASTGWLDAAERELVKRAEEARSGAAAADGADGAEATPYSDWETLAWAFYVLGRGWVPSTSAGADAQVKDDLSFQRLLAAAAASDKSSGVSTKSKTLVALTLLEAGDASNALVTATVADVTSRLRVQGRTAYVAYGDAGTQFPADVQSQTLSLELLLKATPTHPLLPKLAAYVANPFRSSGSSSGSGDGSRYSYVTRPSFQDVGLGCGVLAGYDSSRGSAQPNLELVATASRVTVLQARFTPASSEPVSSHTGWQELPSEPGALVVQATGTGEVSIAASLHFVPAKLLPYPSYRGIYVESAIQLLEPFTGSPTGKPLKTVPLASVVAYTVQITTPDDLGPVTISVMMPGGLEPLDPNVPGSSGGINGPGSYCPMYSVSNAWRSALSRWYWPICPTQVTTPSAVTFNFQALMAGTSTVTIKAVAASVGSFVLPPVRAYADQQPEVMGMTAGGAITVCQGCQPAYAEAGAQLKGCPNNCNGNGVCNPSSGVCTCDEGLSGLDCTMATV